MTSARKCFGGKGDRTLARYVSSLHHENGVPPPFDFQSDELADATFTAVVPRPAAARRTEEGWPFMLRSTTSESALRNSQLSKLKSTSNGFRS
jgi:hypothetical protein